jgi:hypothetical protein
LPENGVALEIGAAFCSPEHLGLSFATNEAYLAAGFERLVAVLDGRDRYASSMNTENELGSPRSLALH